MVSGGLFPDPGRFSSPGLAPKCPPWVPPKRGPFFHPPGNWARGTPVFGAATQRGILPRPAFLPPSGPSPGQKHPGPNWAPKNPLFKPGAFPPGGPTQKPPLRFESPFVSWAPKKRFKSPLVLPLKIFGHKLGYPMGLKPFPVKWGNFRSPRGALTQRSQNRYLSPTRLFPNSFKRTQLPVAPWPGIASSPRLPANLPDGPRLASLREMANGHPALAFILAFTNLLRVHLYRIGRHGNGASPACWCSSPPPSWPPSSSSRDQQASGANG